MSTPISFIDSLSLPVPHLKRVGKLFLFRQIPHPPPDFPLEGGGT